MLGPNGNKLLPNMLAIQPQQLNLFPVNDGFQRKSSVFLGVYFEVSYEFYQTSRGVAQHLHQHLHRKSRWSSSSPDNFWGDKSRYPTSGSPDRNLDVNIC